MSSIPCYICGKGMEELRLDGRDMKPRPCTTCEDVIQETAFGRCDDPNQTEETMTWGDWVLNLDMVSPEDRIDYTEATNTG